MRALSTVLIIASSMGVLSNSRGPLFVYDICAWDSVIPGITVFPPKSILSILCDVFVNSEDGPAYLIIFPSIQIEASLHMVLLSPLNKFRFEKIFCLSIFIPFRVLIVFLHFQ